MEPLKENVPIQSDEILTDIEHHFRVFAGPGAGKTTWLIEHLKNVLTNSTRLGKTSKIACITYTNIASEEIQERLGEMGNRVEISTIHSFLYRNVIKPFAFLLKDSDNKNLINLKELDGHDEHLPHISKIQKWKRDNNLFYIKDDTKLYECLSELEWKFTENGLELLPRHLWKLNNKFLGGKYFLKRDYLIEYKKLYWNAGQIHHEDVLYFAYRLIEDYPRILEFLRKKFVYIFVDEFQDTNPIQTYIIKRIAESDTIVGVIGDLAQSIYLFQDARRQDFIEFKLKDHFDYQIKGNRRSTNKIITLLNKIRGDELQQVGIDSVEGDTIKLYVGNVNEVIDRIKVEIQELPTTVVYTNEYLAKIKYDIKGKSTHTLLDELIATDSNSKRGSFIYSILMSTELAYQNRNKEAIAKLTKYFKKDNENIEIALLKKREIVINIIKNLISDRESVLEKTIFDVYNTLYQELLDKYNIKVEAKISNAGTFSNFAQNHKYKEFLPSLKIEKDSTDKLRTIHSTKGAEYNSVLVAFENEAELQFIIAPKMNDDKDDRSRIYYVALSRAKKELFITVPSLNNYSEAIKEMGIEIIKL